MKKSATRSIIHLIECKNLSKKDQEKNAIYISKEKIQGLIKKATKHNAEALVAYSFPYQHVRIVEARRLKSSGKMLFVEREDGMPLKGFLKQVGQTKLPDQ